jgi:hypothetical protein
MPVYRLGSGQAVVFMFNPLKGARQVLWRELTAARITTMPTSVSVSAHRDVGQTGFSRDPPNGGHTAMKRGGCGVGNQRFFKGRPGLRVGITFNGKSRAEGVHHGTEQRQMALNSAYGAIHPLQPA